MFKLFEKYPRLAAIVSTKEFGSMKIFADGSESDSVQENRHDFLKKNGIDTGCLVGACLCHGKDVKEVSIREAGGTIREADALVTKEKGLFLSVTVADCLPIYFFDQEKEIVGIAHAGWRGLEIGIISEAIGKMKSLGSLSENILAGIGPAIGFCHYEVGQEVAEKFEVFGSEVRREESGKILDIKRIAEIQLIENGVLEKNIEKNPECTFCEKEKYFSFRRDVGGDIKKLEAMMAAIGIRK